MLREFASNTHIARLYGSGIRIRMSSVMIDLGRS